MERIWFDITQLPSGGISYPEDWKISITPYSFGDVMGLVRAAETGTGALDKILTGVRCSFDKDLLLPADILFLGIYRKLVSTKHSKIEFEVDCPACAKKNKKVMDLSELKFKELEIPELPICAELETGTLEFIPITYKSYKEAVQKYKGDPSWLLAYSVANKEPWEAREAILNAVDLDREVLDHVASLLDFGLKPIEFPCQDEFCDHELKVHIDSPEVMVMPFRGSDQSVESRIKFGSKSSGRRSKSAES